ncbi:UDP-4-amino-4,6-dideoxy-N-acetyl-beta-L-altrosamine transaminase [Helicobacter monodelphidis]|uniref:UDP-4-amino-4, 6-dideoxy-N-acetyl-beta-L-altrosamine transaminase n=1 Tax=Helicobacter sp. 15-1451 TaxID=2004995 RepID=UPI000DCB0A79|nr:UDP-4-amino-4,6-dideoxy-N-acetyl-beta-L-altrosamine transaminase [Helicobacter sp. 15-1451]RAX58156.1 UDP-4-amino-4,6-dideoxy-N-acetyl-beta-L-altrosamine transaminase [Helicobacter sp. 15-1451]
MIPYSKQSISSQDVEAVCDALRSSHLTQGMRVVEFEKRVARVACMPSALALNSATSALYVAYRVLGIQPGDEVITTPNSYVATSNMLLALGAVPVFCDIKSDGNIDENLIESLITPKTKAIVSVDYSGKSVAVKEIADIAQRRHLLWISDSSHSFGGSYCNQMIGSFADATVFSFHAIKTITTAEGGAVIFKDDSLTERARMLHSHGVQKGRLWNSEVEEFGFNFRLNELSAALGISQIQKLQAFVDKRRVLVEFYDNFFKSLDWVETLSQDSSIQSTHHLYPILLHSSLWCAKEDIFELLWQHGIGVQVHYKPINSYKCYGADTTKTTKAQEFYLAELSIPCHQEMDIVDAQRVAKKIQETCEKFL